MNSLTIQLSGHIGSFSLQANLHTPSTSILGIYGHSAAGKTMLLRGIAGLEPSFKGLVKINQSTWLDTVNGIALPPHQRKVGYVFQEPRLLSHLTVEKNLQFAQKRPHKDTPRMQKETLFDFLDLWDLLKRYPSQLSGGQQQRVAIARAAISEPDLFLMDEPLSHLNRALKDNLMILITQLAHELKRPIIYVSHDYSEITRLASHVSFVEEGQFQPIQTLKNIEVVP